MGWDLRGCIPSLVFKGGLHDAHLQAEEDKVGIMNPHVAGPLHVLDSGILHVQAAPAWWLFVVDMGGNKEG